MASSTNLLSRPLSRLDPRVVSVMQANAIIGTPNILFLGAGASKPYGKLLMGEFIESVRGKIEGYENVPKIQIVSIHAEKLNQYP